MGKILVIVAVVITFLTAVLGFLNKGKLSDANTRADAAAKEAAAQKASLATAKTDLDKSKKDLAAAVADKEQSAAALASAQSDLATAKAAATEATGKVATLTENATKLQSDLDAANKALEDAKANQPTVASGPSAEDKAKDEEQKTLIAKLQSDLDAARAKVDNYVKLDETRKGAMAAKSMEGRVLAVNPAWNFVVLSLGDKNGVSSNTELLVKRGNQLVGKIRVTSVEPSTSIADIVANSVPQGTSISPGDHVIYQGSKE